MKFGNTLNSYIKANNLKLKPLQENTSIYTRVLFESFLLEAKKAKSDLYRDLTISGTAQKVTAEDVVGVKFYVKGKSVKDGKSPEEAKKMNEKQADLINKIFAKVKQDSTDNKTTLIELTAAAFSIFKADGQNKPTCGYNLRGVLSILISKNKLLVPADGGSVNAGNIIVDPGDGVVDSESESGGDQETPENAQEEPVKSKFDNTLTKNEPTAVTDTESNDNTYLHVDKGARVSKEEMESRDDRIAANYIIDTLKEELPGFFDKTSLFAQTQEENSGMSERDVSVMIDKLIELNKVKYVPKGTSEEEEIVPDREEEGGSSSAGVEDPRDLVDRQISGSTRKGFGGDNFDYSGFNF